MTNHSVIWLIVGSFLLGAVPAFAQGPGVQAGISGTPSQFYLGGQYELHSGIERLWFRPNVDVGFGHDKTATGINVEFVYRQPLENTDWRMYFGAGPALDITRVRSTTSAGGGLNLLVGVSHTHGLFTEIKVGLVEGPGIRFGVGYGF